jgi:hypothetical protein
MAETQEKEEISPVQGTATTGEPVEDFEVEDFVEEDESEELSVAEKVIGIFISPKHTFKYLAEHPDFWSAFIIMALVMIALGMVSMMTLMSMLITQTIEQTRTQLAASGMTEEELAATVSKIQQYMPYFLYLQAAIGQPINLLVAWLLLTVGVFFFGLMQGLKTDFKKLFGVLPWLSFVSMLPVQIISAVIVNSGRIAEIGDMANMRIMKPYSLMILIPQNIVLPKFVEGILGSIDPFFIWSIVLMVIALEYANTCKRSQAIVTTIILSILGLLITAAMVNLQGLAKIGAS